MFPDFLSVGKKLFIGFQIISVFLVFFCLFGGGGNKWPDVLSKSVRKLESFSLFTRLCASQLWSLHKVHTNSKILSKSCVFRFIVSLKSQQ